MPVNIQTGCIVVVTVIGLARRRPSLQWSFNGGGGVLHAISSVVARLNA